jgi:uncharacterized membrane protein
MLRSLTIAAHIVLLAAITLALIDAIGSSPAREIVIAIVAAPLLLTLPGLVRRRRSVLPWIAVLLVPFVGGAIVEAIAAQTLYASIALFAALAELALVLAIIRRPSADSE